MRSIVQLFIMIKILATVCNSQCPRKCVCYSIVVHCENKSLTKLPHSVPEGTVQLLIEHNFIQKIPLYIENIDNLHTLTLQENAINWILSSNFANFGSINYLDLSNNQIASIPHNAFQNLTQLHYLSLRNNNISRISSNAFCDLPALQDLSIANNRLWTIAPQLFVSLRKLQSLDLSENHLHILPDQIFKSLSKLIQLNLSNNRIKKITRQSVVGLTNIEELHLSNNSISMLDHLSDSDTPSCDDVITSPKKIKLRLTEDGWLTKMKKLNYVDLSGNQLQLFNYESFKGLTNLHTLVLQNNHWSCSCYLKWSLTKLRDSIGNLRLAYKETNCFQPVTLRAFNLDDFLLHDLSEMLIPSMNSQKEKRKPIKRIYFTIVVKDDQLPYKKDLTTPSLETKINPKPITVKRRTHVFPAIPSSNIANEKPKLFSVIRSENKSVKQWMAGLIAVLSVFVVMVIVALIVHNQYGKRESALGCCLKKKKKNNERSYIRSVSNYPILYENPLATRPLPVTNTAAQNSSSVRWTNGGLFQLGSSSPGLASHPEEDFEIPENSSFQRNKVTTKMSLERHGSLVATYVNSNEKKVKILRRNAHISYNARKTRPGSVVLSAPKKIHVQSQKFRSQMNIREDISEDLLQKTKPIKMSKKFAFETTPTHKSQIKVKKLMPTAEKIDRSKLENNDYTFAEDTPYEQQENSKYHILALCSSGNPTSSADKCIKTMENGDEENVFKNKPKLQTLKDENTTQKRPPLVGRKDSTDSMFVSLHSTHGSVTSECLSDSEEIVHETYSSETTHKVKKHYSRHGSKSRKERLKLFGSDEKILNDLYLREKKMMQELQLSNLEMYKMALSESSDDDNVFSSEVTETTQLPKENESKYTVKDFCDFDLLSNREDQTHWQKTRNPRKRSSNPGIYNAWMPLSFYESHNSNLQTSDNFQATKIPQKLSYSKNLQMNKTNQQAYKQVKKTRRPSSCIFPTEELKLPGYNCSSNLNTSLQNLKASKSVSKKKKRKEERQHCYFKTLDSTTSDDISTDVESLEFEFF